MKSNQLLVLGGVAVAALLLALLLSGRGGDAPGGAGRPLLAGLDQAINAVSEITVREGDARITLARGDEGWQVADRDGYPADVGKVRELLLSLADATLLEQKTRNPENYATLGLQPADAGGTTVTLTADDRRFEGATVTLGNSARQGSATYVRRDDEAVTWLASGDLSASAETSAWVDTQILDVPASDVQAVTIEHADGAQVRISKASRSETGFTVADIPEGKELRYASIANPIGSALSGLRLEDVRAADAADLGEAAATARFATFDGLIVTARAFEADGESLVTLSAQFDPAQAERFAPSPDEGDTGAAADADATETAVNGAGPNANGDGATSDATADAEPSPAATGADAPEEATDAQAGDAANDARARAEALQARLSPWVFVIGSYKVEQLTRRMDDLVQDPPPTPDADAG